MSSICWRERDDDQEADENSRKSPFKISKQMPLKMTPDNNNVLLRQMLLMKDMIITVEAPLTSKYKFMNPLESTLMTIT